MTENNIQVAVPQITKEDFLRRVANTLGTYKWPKGSIECIDPDKTKLVYLWGNRYKGHAEGAWSAKVNGNHKINVNNKDVELADGTPYSGPIPSVNFDLLVINDNQATPYWAKEFSKVGFKSENFQPYSSVDACGGCVEGEDTANSSSIWMKNGNEIVDGYLYPLAVSFSQDTALAYIALNVLPAQVVQQSASMFSNMKFDSRDVTASSRNSITEDPTPVLIPFYLLEFQFEGKPYYVAMMANDSYAMKGQIPPVNEDSKTPQQIVEEEMPAKVKQAKILKWGWTLAIILFIIFNIPTAIVYLIAWFIGQWILTKPIKDRIKELQQQDADNSQKTAALLTKQLTK